MFGENDTDNKNHVSFSKCVNEMFIGPFGSSLKNECFVEGANGYCMVYEQKHAIRKGYQLDNRFVDKNKYMELKRFTVCPGDIIVSCRGTIGETYIIPQDAPMGIMHPSIMKIRLKETAYNTVFFNHLLSRFFIRNTSANGSSVKMAITATNLGQLRFILPPLSLQNRFAEFVKQADKSEFAAQRQTKIATLLYNSVNGGFVFA